MTNTEGLPGGAGTAVVGRAGRHSAAPAHRRSSPRQSRAVYACALLATFGALMWEWLAMLRTIRGQGVTITGDEPHYLVESVALGRFHTMNMVPAYNYVVEHHIVYPFAGHPGPALARAVGQGGFFHHQFLPFHAIGMSALLAGPMLIGTDTATVALIALMAALTVSLVHLTGELSGVRSPGRLAIAALFLAPAFGLAATQVYPDLLTGLIVANVVMIIALVETRKRCPGVHLLALTALLVVLPWLDQKNIFFPVPLLVAFLVVWRRAGLPFRRLRPVIALVLVSLAGLLLLNLYQYGHLLGAPQAIELIGKNTITRFVALLVDRRQGLIIQVPVVLLGLASMWAARRRLPVTIVISLGVVLAFLWGNATQPANFGGYSFTGRFQWPTLPLLVAFAGLYLLELWKVRRLAVGILASVIAAAYVFQMLPILRSEHAYYNGPPGDPTAYSGWWGGLDPSPRLAYIGHAVFHNARNLWGLAFLVLVCGIALYCLTRILDRPARWNAAGLGVSTVAAVVSLVVALSSSVLPAAAAHPGDAPSMGAASAEALDRTPPVGPMSIPPGR